MVLNIRLNKIQAAGVKHLRRAQWRQLRELNMGTRDLT